MWSTSNSPFIDQALLPAIVLDFVRKSFGSVDWCRKDICDNLAFTLLKDYGFVSLMDLGSKLQAYVDNGYIDTLRQQYGVNQDVGTSSQYSYIPPKYQVQAQIRGEGEDKFFCTPINVNMIDNALIIETLNYGSDENVCALPNLSCSCPAVKMKCDVACESMLFIQATHTLMTDFGVTALADIYRFLGMMGDRKCVWCKGTTSSKISCVSGTFQCINCLNKYQRLDFKEAFKAWMDAGCPAKHASQLM